VSPEAGEAASSRGHGGRATMSGSCGAWWRTRVERRHAEHQPSDAGRTSGAEHRPGGAQGGRGRTGALAATTGSRGDRACTRIAANRAQERGAMSLGLASEI
jgi:hypothetical protein